MFTFIGAILLTLTAPGLPACEHEDGSTQRVCVWDARHAGNGEGHSAIIRRGGTEDQSIQRVTHRRAHRLIENYRGQR